MSYDGFYINLESNPDRREKMDAQLQSLSLKEKYSRFPAIAGNALGFPGGNLKTGELGAFSSHFKLLESQLNATRPIHVVEDDVIFANCMEQAITWLINNGFFEKYDVIYTDLFIPTTLAYYKTYKSLFDRVTVRDALGKIKEVTFQIINLEDRKFGTASSLIIAHKFIPKLYELYGSALKSGPEQPIDLFVWQQAMKGVIKAACLFPFTTSLRLEHSLSTTIGERYQQLSVLARDIVRASFFIDRDLKSCQDYARDYLSMPPDPHLDLLLDVLAFSFSEKFVDI